MGNQMTNIMAMRRTVRTNIIFRIGGSRRHWCQGLSLIKFIYLYGVCLRVCSLPEKWVKSYCSIFRCYLVKFVQSWTN
jgi:hypothetical protein